MSSSSEKPQQQKTQTKSYANVKQVVVCVRIDSRNSATFDKQSSFNIRWMCVDTRCRRQAQWCAPFAGQQPPSLEPRPAVVGRTATDVVRRTCLSCIRPRRCCRVVCDNVDIECCCVVRYFPCQLARQRTRTIPSPAVGALTRKLPSSHSGHCAQFYGLFLGMGFDYLGCHINYHGSLNHDLFASKLQSFDGQL